MVRRDQQEDLKVTRIRDGLRVKRWATGSVMYLRQLRGSPLLQGK
jgi:hypothetical protein